MTETSSFLAKKGHKVFLSHSDEQIALIYLFGERTGTVLLENAVSYRIQSVPSHYFCSKIPNLKAALNGSIDKLNL